VDYPPTDGTGARLGWAAFALLVVGVLLALALLFDLGPFAEDPLSEAEFLAQGDEICRQAHEDFERLQARAPATAQEAADLTDELGAISRDELDRIHDLEAPAELQTALDRYLDARQAGIDRLEAGAKAAAAGDAVDYANAQAKVADSQLTRLKLARAVGFDQCSRVLFGRDQLARDREPPLNTDPGAPPTINNPPTGVP
jgi:predicted transcriptional regulator